MFVRLLLLFTVVPLVELALLIWIGQQIGTLATVGLVLVTGVAGAALAKVQGWRTWWNIKLQLARGRAPAAPLLDGLMILMAACLLVTPGVLTDLVGFALLTPPIRAVLRAKLAAWLTGRLKVRFESIRMRTGAGPGARAGETVFDAEFTSRPADEAAPENRNSADERRDAQHELPRPPADDPGRKQNEG